MDFKTVLVNLKNLNFQNVLLLAVKLLPVVVFILIAFSAKEFVLHGHRNASTHFQEVQRDGYASTPAFVQVSPSTSESWNMTKNDGAATFWKVIGGLFFWISVAIIALVCLGIIPDSLPWCREWQISLALFVCLLIWLSGTYAAYDAVYSNNYVDIPVQQYDSLKNVTGGLDSLFEHKPVIR